MKKVKPANSKLKFAGKAKAAMTIAEAMKQLSDAGYFMEDDARAGLKCSQSPV